MTKTTLAAYVRATSADDAFSAALRRAFKGDAGDRRYEPVESWPMRVRASLRLLRQTARRLNEDLTTVTREQRAQVAA